MVLAVAGNLNAGCGLITRLWSSSEAARINALDHDITSGRVVFIEAERDIVR